MISEKSRSFLCDDGPRSSHPSYLSYATIRKYAPLTLKRQKFKTIPLYYDQFESDLARMAASVGHFSAVRQNQNQK